MSAHAHKILQLIRRCKESLANLADYKVTAVLDGTLQETWAEFITNIGVVRVDFILLSQNLSSRIPVEELQDPLNVIKEHFLKAFRGNSDDAKFVMKELSQCSDALNSLYHQLPTTTPSVTEHYKLERRDPHVISKHN